MTAVADTGHLATCPESDRDWPIEVPMTALKAGPVNLALIDVGRHCCGADFH